MVSFKLSRCMKYPWNRNLEMAFRVEEMYFAEYRTLGQEVAYTLVKTARVRVQTIHFHYYLSAGNGYS